MASAAGSGRPRHTGRVLPLLALVAAGACADRAVPRASVAAIPLDAAATASAFARQAPAARAEPADSLRMLRTLGDTSSFGGIDKIVVVGEKLLVLDYLMNPHLAVVDVASGRVVENFGRNGAGPREFKAPHWAFPVRGRPEAWVFDPGNFRLSLVGLDGDADGRIRRSIQVPPETQVETPTFFGNTLVATGFFPDYTLLVMNERGEPVRRVAVEPPFSNRDVRHQTAMKLLNRAFLASDASGRRIALAYQWADRLDFFTADGRLLGTARGPRSTRASYRIQDARFFWNDDSEMAYWTVAASDSHVFALYAGPPASKPQEYEPSRVHVFTWSGEFVRELAFDRPVYGLALAPDGHTLFAPYHSRDGHQLIGMWRVPPDAVAD